MFSINKQFEQKVIFILCIIVYLPYVLTKTVVYKYIKHANIFGTISISKKNEILKFKALFCFR